MRARAAEGQRPISIHALLAESDARKHRTRGAVYKISIHALLAESDYTGVGTDADARHFYPRSPCGERRRPRGGGTIECQRFLSTLSLRRATSRQYLRLKNRKNFYPRSPCGERLSLMLYDTSSLIFLSTLSLRRATIEKPITFYPPVFLSTLSLRRATAKVHKTVGHFCAYETHFMEIASSC